MDTPKTITLKDIQDLAAKTKFHERLLTKDYFITRFLYLMKDIKNVYFKGGTALQKTILAHSRLSEDIDFTVTGDLNAAEQKIISTLIQEKSIKKIEKDKSVDGFVRLVLHYKNFRNQDDTIFIDLNKRASLTLTPVKS